MLLLSMVVMYSMAADISLTANGVMTRYPNALTGLKVDESIEMKIGLEDAVKFPEQSVLELTSPEEENSYFSFAQRKDTLHLLLDVAKDLETPCQYLSNDMVEYTATMYISDPKLGAPVKWALGKVAIHVKNNPALHQKCELSEATLWSTRKEFTHEFKPAAPRAPATVALLFTGIVLLVPNMMLLNMSGKLHIGTTGAHMNFIFLLVGLMSIVVIYWLDIIKLFPTLFFLMVLGAVATAMRPRPGTEKKKNE